MKPIIRILLLVLLITGICYRFLWVNWSQGTNLHPDEYGLTSTLTRLSLPTNLGDYFNTRISPLSPYPQYDPQGAKLADGPDNRLRWGQWPIIMIRAAAELTGNTGYDEMRLMGRSFSALVDTLTLLLIFLIGAKLYSETVGLLAAVLSGLAVMQIQQSHFMTVDNFSVFFAALTMYAAVNISKAPPVLGGGQNGPYRTSFRALGQYVLFGVGLGMTLASKINLLPLGGLLLVAAFIGIADLKLKSKPDLTRIFTTAAVFLLVSAACALITFRVTQPMSFRAPQGDTGFFTLQLNPDWTDSMKVASDESNGIGGGPPAEQWANRPVIIFPLMNMVVWGMGLPLGLAVWVAFGLAGWQVVRYGRSWRAHLLPLVWAGGYFAFMATRWVKSIRYFLPIYPFLCLLAAWMLVELVQGHFQLPSRLNGFFRQTLLGKIVPALVVGGTLIWATAFVDAVYMHPHSRIQAANWMYSNIPAPFQLELVSDSGPLGVPVAAPDGLTLQNRTPYVVSFTPHSSGKLSGVWLPHVFNPGSDSTQLLLTIYAGEQGQQPIDEVMLDVAPSQAARGVEVKGSFKGARLEAGQTYTLAVTTSTSRPVLIFRSVVSNEDWDEGLPMPLNGYDPFGQFYNGISMNVRWVDDENKRKMYEQNLAQVDYIILPSQRGIWSSDRLPRMYPMTIAYYRALFNGQLGFDRVATFQNPIRIGPLAFSDAGGTLGWNADPPLPVFNFNFFAAEEAFTIYDHPPVWVFKKRADFNLQQADNLLDQIDLSKVVVQSPRDVVTVPFK